jgi:DNA repair exonuclease SbcCD ATPase subunit
MTTADSNQIARMIEWLDEERRRDRARIIKMEEVIGSQQDLIEQMSRRMNSLEAENTGLRAAFLPAGRDAELVESLRGELHHVVEGLEAKRISSEREAERRNDIAREAVSRPVRELESRISALEGIQDELAAARVERERFFNGLTALNQRVEDTLRRSEDPERRLARLEEQRSQDSRRIGEAQLEVPELRRQIDALKPKFDLLESFSLRNEKQILEVQGMDRDRQTTLQTFIDQQTLSAQQRDARVEEIRNSFGHYEEEMRKRFDRFESWSETHRQMKQVVTDFNRVSERLEKRITEIAEMQRVAEDRFRQEWGAWTGDDAKRWKTFTLSNDEARRQQDRSIEELRTRAAETMAMFTPVQDSLDRLWKFERGLVDGLRERLNSLLSEYDQPSERPRPIANGRGTQSMRAIE